MPALDGIRGVAILLVVFHNARLSAVATDALIVRLYAVAANAGWVGVQLFFALSGFLITGILLDTRGGERWLGRFYARRVLRIFPLYYAALAATAIAIALVPAAREAAAHGGIPLAWYWSYLANWRMPWAIGVPWLGHFWSLAVEEQFYLAWPLAVRVLRPRALVALCVTVVVLALVARVALVDGVVLAGRAGLGAAYFWTTSRCDALLLGAIGAVVCRTMPRDALRRLARRGAWVAVAALAGLVVVRRGLAPIDAGALTLGQSLVAVAAAAWIVGAALPHDSAQRSTVLAHPWLRAAGKYSYAIYVLHVPIALAAAPTVARLVEPLAPWPRVGAQLAWAAALFALSLAGALVTWHTIERPFLRLKRFFPRRLDGPSAAA